MSIQAASTLRRSLLYVPAISPKYLKKSLSLPFALDTVCYDLEDSVVATEKKRARSLLLKHLNQSRARFGNVKEICVRINDVGSGFAEEDLTAILQVKNLDALVIPKADQAMSLKWVTDVLRRLSPERHPSSSGVDGEGKEKPIKIIALIESAQALHNLREICTASPYLDGLIFGAEDFALDLSLRRTPSLGEFHFARSMISTAARAHNLGSTIDLVCTKFQGEEGMRALGEECIDGKGMGFNGKQCIHPDQVELVQKSFGPSEEEVEWAAKVVIGDEKAEARGRGAWTLEGNMIDKPVAEKAKAVLKRAGLCGFDVDAVREKWKDQEPE